MIKFKTETVENNPGQVSAHPIIWGGSATTIVREKFLPYFPDKQGSIPG